MSKSVLDKSFRYHDSTDTDLRRTFRRVRAELKLEAARQVEAQAKVKPMIRKTGGGT